MGGGGAASTSKITEMLCKDSIFRSITNQPIGTWFYDRLRHFYHLDPDSVNFETILNCIEMLKDYYSTYLKGPSILNTNIIYSVFLKEKDGLEEILAFDRIYPKTPRGWWESHNERIRSYNFWNDCEMFFQKVHKHFVRLISIEIEKYEGKCLNEEFNDINNNLKKMIQYLANKGVVRSYTLNYDRLLKRISGIDFFEGFSVNDGENEVFNSREVFNCQDDHCHYNLHGSIHHNFEIIAGLNKSARILENPYSQLYHAFYRDCFNAEEIVTIGYSFSDVHINRAITEGSIANKEQRILCIDWHPLPNELNFDKQTEYDLFIYSSRNFRKFMGEHHCLEKIATKENCERIIYFKKGFKSFLDWGNLEYLNRELIKAK
jgi:hypothetical protein